MSRLREYEVDDEAKAAFREALSAHGHRLYRVCVRSVFPEIERLARLELPPAKGGPQVALIAAAGDLGVADFEPGGSYALQLFTKLETQAYAQVWTDEQAAIASGFAAPSRHGALHGRVAYSSRQNSVNALILADFVLQIVSATKQNRALVDEERCQAAA